MALYSTIKPSLDQEHLLKACLLRDLEKAETSLHVWREMVDVDELDPGSLRLIPLLWRRIQENGWTHPAAGRLKGIYRKSWVQSQLHQREVIRMLDYFESHGIESSPLKGLALSYLVYDDPYTRPMTDVDFLLDKKDIPAALEFFRGRGWRMVSHHVDLALKYLHAIGVVNPDQEQGGGEVDLHWHVLRSRIGGAGKGFFEVDRETVRLPGDRMLRTMGCEDHFLHACEHGVRYCPWSTLRWLADCFFLVTRSREWQWNRVVEGAERFRIKRQVFMTLEYLQSHLEVEVPPQVLRQLKRGSSGLTTGLALWLSCRRRQIPRKEWKEIVLAICQYACRGRTERVWGELPDYIRAERNMLLDWKGEFNRKILELKCRWRDFYGVWLPHINQRISGSGKHLPRSLAMMRRDDLIGFYQVEISPLEQLLRWCQPEAGIRLKQPARALGLEIGVENIRPPAVLRRDGIRFYVNGQRLSDGQVSYGKKNLVLDLSEWTGKRAVPVTVSWRVAPFCEAHGDPRLLGFPVFTICWVGPASE